jgi:hypothetical protein
VTSRTERGTRRTAYVCPRPGRRSERCGFRRSGATGCSIRFLGSSALIERALEKQTREGRRSFLGCRITAGHDKGRDVEYLIRSWVPEGSPFHGFLVHALGQANAGQDIDARDLIGQRCIVQVEHVVRGRGKNRRTYANATAILVPKEEHLNKPVLRKAKREGNAGRKRV